MQSGPKLGRPREQWKTCAGEAWEPEAKEEDEAAEGWSYPLHLITLRKSAASIIRTSIASTVSVFPCYGTGRGMAS